jgi:hypothetical protein
LAVKHSIIRVIYFLRLDPGTSAKQKKRVGMYYRAFQVQHTWAMDFYTFLLPAYITGSELLTVASLFFAIRLNAVLGLHFTVIMFLVGIITFIILKVALEFSAKVGELSVGFSRNPFLPEGRQFTREDKSFLKSCKPLKLRVGSSFSIVKDTFPTISQDIILGNLINLLITF